MTQAPPPQYPQYPQNRRSRRSAALAARRRQPPQNSAELRRNTHPRSPVRPSGPPRQTTRRILRN